MSKPRTFLSNTFIFKNKQRCIAVERRALPKMTREELIKLGKRIIKAKGTESELDELNEVFNQNVPYPNGVNLFYYPENYNARKDNLNLYNPTVESIVDKCLNYKAINL